MNGEMVKIQSMIIWGSLLNHVIYGAVLGAITTLLLIKTQTPKAK